MYTLNNEAASSYVQVDDDLIECIQQAQKVYSLSSQFDITQGAVLSLWHDAREESIVLNDEGKALINWHKNANTYPEIPINSILLSMVRGADYFEYAQR